MALLLRVPRLLRRLLLYLRKNAVPRSTLPPRITSRYA